jgi:hypothetical protein
VVAIRIVETVLLVLGIDDGRSIENLISHTFVNRAWDQPNPVLLCQGLVAGFRRPRHRFCKTEFRPK